MCNTRQENNNCVVRNHLKMFFGTFKYLSICVVVVLQFDTHECWGGRHSSSRPSPHRPFPRPSPTYRPFPRPSPTHRPFTHAPTYRPFPTHAPTFRPFPTHSPTHRPFPTHSPTHRPFPTQSPTYRPFPTQSPTYKPFPTHSPTYRPIPTHYPTYKPSPTHFPTYRPAPGPTFRPTHRPTYSPTRYPTQPTRYPVGPHPSYPGFGHGGGGFNQGRPYRPSYTVPLRVPSSGGTKIKVYNINNYHRPSYWAPPSYPVYHYSSRDTGSTALGFYLGYSLGRITHPTYYHHHHTNFYDGYNPRYDHYTVHHYYHNRASVPPQQIVNTQVIITCGDSSQICPANTTSLCTASGQIMCVVVATNTVPCKDDPNLKCVRSMVPCENNDTPECKGVQKGQQVAINIPCVSNTIIEGNVTTVNNTIVSLDKNKNGTSNLTDTGVTTLPITTLPPVGVLAPNDTFPSMGVRTKRQAQPNYCVTVIAQPSVRKPTEGEQVFNEISNVFDKFFTKAFGMDKFRQN